MLQIDVYINYYLKKIPMDCFCMESEEINVKGTGPFKCIEVSMRLLFNLQGRGAEFHILKILVR